MPVISEVSLVQSHELIETLGAIPNASEFTPLAPIVPPTWVACQCDAEPSPILTRPVTSW